MHKSFLSPSIVLSSKLHLSFVVSTMLKVPIMMIGLVIDLRDFQSLVQSKIEILMFIKMIVRGLRPPIFRPTQEIFLFALEMEFSTKWQQVLAIPLVVLLDP